LFLVRIASVPVVDSRQTLGIKQNSSVDSAIHNVVISSVHSVSNAALQTRHGVVNYNTLILRPVVLDFAKAVLARPELLEQSLHHRALIALLEDVHIEGVSVHLLRCTQLLFANLKRPQQRTGMSFPGRTYRSLAKY
jgi:hypothetical protein